MRMLINKCSYEQTEKTGDFIERYHQNNRDSSNLILNNRTSQSFNAEFEINESKGRLLLFLTPRLGYLLLKKTCYLPVKATNSFALFSKWLIPTKIGLKTLWIATNLPYVIDIVIEA